MGLDQRIWAELQVDGAKKKVAIHYWRKDRAIDRWFFSRLPKSDQEAIEAENQTVWSYVVTPADLELLTANEHSLAFKLGFDTELIWRCERALENGFKLVYARDN
jgi:hypothetical protein